MSRLPTHVRPSDPEFRANVAHMEALRKQGVPFDLTQLRPQHIEELVDQLDDLTVHVEQPDVKVQIFAE